MKYYIYPRLMTGRLNPELQIKCDSIIIDRGCAVFERISESDERDVETVALMAPGTWGVINSADGLQEYRPDEVAPAVIDYPDPTKETA